MPRPPRPELMALLADVKQNPDDLTPWLVLCDWLEDQDDEAERARGEYCRLCFDKLGVKAYASDWERGERRRHVYRTYHDAWFGPIVPLKPRVEKGLLTIKVDDLQSYVEELDVDREAWAWVGSLQFIFGFGEILASKCDVGWLIEGLHTLAIESALDDREVATLAAWPALRRVRVLRLEVPLLNSGQADCLAGSPHLEDLRTLEIDLRSWPTHTHQCTREEGIGRLQQAFGERLMIWGR